MKHANPKTDSLKRNILCLLATVLLISCANNDNVSSRGDWTTYRGDDGGNAYSPLDEINRDNVNQLKVAWSYRTGGHSGNSTIQCNPLIVDGILYGMSPTRKVFALDAKSGKELWVFNPYEARSNEGGVSRGLAFWKNDAERRIYMTASYRLLAIDATTGKQIMSFGDSGYVDMRKGLGKDDMYEKYSIDNTSPGVIHNNLIIVGSRLGESYGGLPGHIRAYDIHTGKMVWIFHTIPHPGERGYETWPKENYLTAGGCNVWSGFTIDRKRGLVYAATGSPGFDFHGGDREGDNLYGNSIIAIDAATGKYKWHFQVTHHDLWDYDLPSPPNLVTIQRDGKKIDALAQITKQGWIFVLDRETGKPLFPVHEKPVPASAMPDECASKTQPYPELPAALSRQHFDSSMITNISPESHAYISKIVSEHQTGSTYLPQHTKGIIQIPGTRGGGEWSGAAVDPSTGIMYVGMNDIPSSVQLVELPKTDPDMIFKLPVLKAGEQVYQNNCAACHGADRKGNGPYPSLKNLADRLSVAQATEVIEKGRNKMPSFVQLSEAEKSAVVAYLYNLKNTVLKKEKSGTVSKTDDRKRYKIKGYTALLDQFGYPGIKPPWGTLNAVDLNTGELIWKRPLGIYPELLKKGIPETGTQLVGGGIVTAGDLMFIGASKDEKFRAIDRRTGTTLWEFQLPAGGYATPSSYEVDGKQYVVIAAGGGGMQTTKPGDYYFAFALPDK